MDSCVAFWSCRRVLVLLHSNDAAQSLTLTTPIHQGLWIRCILLPELRDAFFPTVLLPEQFFGLAHVHVYIYFFTGGDIYTICHRPLLAHVLAADDSGKSKCTKELDISPNISCSIICFDVHTVYPGYLRLAGALRSSLQAGT